MSYTASTSKLLAPIFGHEKMSAVFSDDHFIQQMLIVEGALATVQAGLGIIPTDAAEAINRAIPSFKPDIAKLQASIDKAGIPVPGLVGQLRQEVGEPAASYIHWGATTQDIVDTALVLQMGQALVILEDRLDQVIKRLAAMTEKHRHTLMVGRTRSQAALPITFGLKTAGWLAPLLRHRQRLAELKPRLLVVEFGGAVGTLAALGDQGLLVQQGLADQLGLAVSSAPWHTQRDTLAEAAGWLAGVCGSLGKMGQDIILMAQSEVGELRESADKSRGGSSTMPQKSNPIISEGLIAIGRINAGLLANMHHAIIQEHERGTHGWLLEWFSLPQMFVHTAAALSKATFLSENLVVNHEHMLANVKATNGLMLAEALSLALTAEMGRDGAKVLVSAAANQALDEGRHLIDVVRKKTSAALDWEHLRDEANYLGETQATIDQVLGDV